MDMETAMMKVSQDGITCQGREYVLVVDDDEM
jgi:hypothetical protein